ncbi:MAG: Na/Pi symporter [Woeseiaceae bacterium]|nr:Na/Pi symporter [Woeseiaceae bacterium]
MQYFDFAIAVFATVILFIYGLQGFSSELQELGQDRMRAVLGRLTQNRYSGFLLGAAMTAVVQSSSAVTSITVALVDSGAITFANSLGVLIGANVGTTVTAWLVSFELTGVGAFFIVLGALIGVLPGPLRTFGKAIFYFGFIFFTLDLLSDALSPLKEDPALGELLAKTANPVVGALTGMVLTALVQSSSAITGLVILLVQQGVIDTQAAMAIIIGSNAGTTVTGLLGSIGMQPAAQRTAQANLLINAIGVLVFLPFTSQLASFADSVSDNPGVAVATGHLVFNVGLAMLMLPWTKHLARLLAPDGSMESGPSAV